jgi:hypothetical protein
VGIVAYCPRGHRVKVKDDLAGRKGICPQCAARFRIPEKGAELPLARVVSLDEAEAAGLPRARAAKQLGASRPQQPAAAEPGVTHPAAADPVAAVEPAAVHPSIAERPDLSWCLAVPGGQPSPPLSGEAMQRWLEAGHATGEELVWRADWPDWVAIRSVFPGLVPPARRVW